LKWRPSGQSSSQIVGQSCPGSSYEGKEQAFKRSTARIEQTLVRLRCPPKLLRTLRKAQEGALSWSKRHTVPPSSCRCENVRCIRQCLSGATMAISRASATTPPTASPPPPLSNLCVTLLSASLSFPRRPPPHSFTSRAFPSPLMSFPVLSHPSPPPVIFSCSFPFFLFLYTSDGSSADLTTAQLMCPCTSTLTAPPLGQYYMFWLLTRPC